MRIALAQLNCALGDVAANISAIRSHTRHAAENGCHLIVFPEMADTGYDMQTIRRLAAPWSAGPVCEIQSIAAEYKTAIACGLSERQGDKFFNAMAVIDASGELIGHYRKAHLFSLTPVCEDDFLEAGDKLVTTELHGFTIGLLICYDIRFPEACRTLALAGADVLAVCAAWPVRRIDHWLTLLTARAMENQLYVAAVNRGGEDGPLKFGGESVMIDPWGSPVVKASGATEQIVMGDIDRDRIVQVRETMAVFKDRRPEIYRCN